MTVTVPLDGRAYKVVIEPQSVLKIARLAGLQSGTRVAVVGDRRLGRVLTDIEGAFSKAGHSATTIAIEANERLKSLRAIEPVYGKLLRAGLDRGSTIVGVGGGTIGDAVGFVAATFLRGIRFVSVPTTLLADVDSAIGGKTGVNHALGKNLIGLFAQPDLVVIDPSLLRSLDRRDRISGLGEIVKYALIADSRLFRTLRSSWRRIVALEEPVTTRVIARCVAIKSEVVAADEREQTGVRRQLNFGHTVAHALENVSGYGILRHGEAVIVGMRAAVALSVRRGHFPAKAAREIDAFLCELPVPSGWRTFSARRIAAATRHDKKRSTKGITFVLLDRIGHTVADGDVTKAELLAVLREIGFS